jgi:hypothetical protein
MSGSSDLQPLPGVAAGFGHRKRAAALMRMQ